jgi:3-oxoacyl-[acyl-carrier protein] reductase
MPLDHFAQPADIASAVAYLAGPEAHFITGTNWNVDGGIAV